MGYRYGEYSTTVSAVELWNKIKSKQKQLKICYLKIYTLIKLKQLSVIYIYICIYQFLKTFRPFISVMKYTCQITVYHNICCHLIAKQWNLIQCHHSLDHLKCLIKRNKISHLPYYVKGNNSRFGSTIQVLPSGIGEYFKLSFINVAVAAISIFHFFLSFIFRNNLCNLYFFYCSKMSFLSQQNSFVRNKVYLVNLLLSFILFHRCPANVGYQIHSNVITRFTILLYCKCNNAKSTSLGLLALI